LFKEGWAGRERVRRQKTEVRSQKTEVRSEKSEDRSRGVLIEEPRRLRKKEWKTVCHEEAFFCGNEPVAANRY
jgi:hypothetical protein